VILPEPGSETVYFNLNSLFLLKTTIRKSRLSFKEALYHPLQMRDEGIYECQVSTQPVRSLFVNLRVVGESRP